MPYFPPSGGDVSGDVSAIKAKTDNLPSDPADQSEIDSDFGTVNGKLDAIDDFVDTEIAAIKSKTDNLPSDPADASDIAAAFQGGDNATNRVAGKLQFKTTAITSAANAGDVTIATVTTQPCYLKSVVVHSDGATTADLTNIAIYAGTAKVLTLIDSVTGVKANIDAQDEQVAWTGAVYLPVGTTVVATLTGAGATAVDLNCIIEFCSVANGGYLA